jgi:isopenicillin N synthase-like dioxygenase
MAIDIPTNGSGVVPETHAPLASLDTVIFSKILDRDAYQINSLVTACKEVGFFYLDVSDQYSASMVNNLDKLSTVMKQWFSQSEDSKRKELAISMASHG